jgi:hypothetical protein
MKERILRDLKERIEGHNGRQSRGGKRAKGAGRRE